MNALSRLSKRERDLAVLLAQGLSNKAIAHRMGLSEKSVPVILSRIYLKMEIGHGDDLVSHRVVLARKVWESMKESSSDPDGSDAEE